MCSVSSDLTVAELKSAYDLSNIVPCLCLGDIQNQWVSETLLWTGGGSRGNAVRDRGYRLWIMGWQGRAGQLVTLPVPSIWGGRCEWIRGNSRLCPQWPQAKLGHGGKYGASSASMTSPQKQYRRNNRSTMIVPLNAQKILNRVTAIQSCLNRNASHDRYIIPQFMYPSLVENLFL